MKKLAATILAFVAVVGGIGMQANSPDAAVMYTVPIRSRGRTRTRAQKIRQ
jgi:hypothetical protein